MARQPGRLKKPVKKHDLTDDDFNRIVANDIPNELDEIYRRDPPVRGKIRLYRETPQPVAPEDKAKFTKGELQRLKDYGDAYAGYRLGYDSIAVAGPPTEITVGDLERKIRGELGEQPGQPERKFDELFSGIRTLADNAITVALDKKAGGTGRPRLARRKENESDRGS